MPKSLFLENDRKALIERIKKLTSGSQRQWGRMNVRQMLEHVALIMKTGLGKYPVAPAGKPFLRTKLMQTFIIYIMPWPKGKAPTGPEYDLVLRNDAGPEFNPGVDELIRTIDEFSNVPPDFHFTDHPAFGVLTRKQWGDLQHKHIDHHLKQFGV